MIDVSSEVIKLESKIVYLKCEIVNFQLAGTLFIYNCLPN